MTRIELFRSLDGQICGFDASGHADFADYGNDIVCAAISAITQTALLGLIDGLGIEVDYSMQDGNLFLQLPEEIAPPLAEKAHVILDTMRLGLLSLSQEQPAHISVRERGAFAAKH